MNRRIAGAILAVALLLVAGGIAWWWRGSHDTGRRGRHGAAAASTSGGAPTEKRSYDLYFPSGSGLRAERRALAAGDDPKDRIRKIVEALLAGPAAAAASPPAKAAAAPPVAAAASATPAAPAKGAPAPPPATPPAPQPAAVGDLVRPFPAEVRLTGVELSADGVAYLDLSWANHDDPPESGSTEELQRVYSVVNSVALNVPEANRVVLLWNGTQRLTFSGHLDTSRPLLPDRTLLMP